LFTDEQAFMKSEERTNVGTNKLVPAGAEVTIDFIVNHTIGKCKATAKSLQKTLDSSTESIASAAAAVVKAEADLLAIEKKIQAEQIIKDTSVPATTGEVATAPIAMPVDEVLEASAEVLEVSAEAPEEVLQTNLELL
jgi:hypothetical protein